MREGGIRSMGPWRATSGSPTLASGSLRQGGAWDGARALGEGRRSRGRGRRGGEGEGEGTERGEGKGR